MLLNNEEMLKINGGGLSKFFWIVSGGLIAFLLGTLSGVVSPKKCN